MIAADRWTAIWKMHRGAYNGLIDYQRYRYATELEIGISVNNSLPDYSRNQAGAVFYATSLKKWLYASSKKPPCSIRC